MSSRGRSRTLQELRLTFFVTTANGSQLLTVITKNFILDVTDVLDPCLCQDYSMTGIKSVQASVLISL